LVRFSYSYLGKSCRFAGRAKGAYLAATLEKILGGGGGGFTCPPPPPPPPPPTQPLLVLEMKYEDCNEDYQRFQKIVVLSL
jgi:hypothetical protein